jgi:hypothetical protein
MQQANIHLFFPLQRLAVGVTTLILQLMESSVVQEENSFDLESNK